ncbi:MAG: hypothetical protein JWN14_289, partial [Chthonomonadales bacterium]|nr:hypothetical protein [Chthonomonadales bacterium]
MEFLVREEPWRGTADPDALPIWISAVEDPSEFHRPSPIFLSDAHHVQHTSGVTVSLGLGRAEGYITGYILLKNGVRKPLNRIHVSTSGMPKFTLDASVRSDLSYKEWETFSRVISGRGMHAFRQMQDLHIAIVGVSGTGSPIAETLVKEYGCREISLVDPDTVHPENLHRMQGVGLPDIGRPKAETVGDYLRTLGPVKVRTAVAHAMTWPALNLLKTADIWICT